MNKNYIILIVLLVLLLILILFMNRPPSSGFANSTSELGGNESHSNSSPSELINQLVESAQTNTAPSNMVVGISLTNTDRQNGFGEDFSERLQREGGKTGDVQISLIWNTVDDLDLHCRDPFGAEIWFKNRRSPSGGELDVDMNALRADSNEPVENIFWPVGSAPKGTYSVEVNFYEKRTFSTPVSFKIAINNKGKISLHNGSVTFEGQRIRIVRFTVE